MEKDLATVVEFVARVRVNCRTLVTNPFNVTAGEALVDLMLEVAPLGRRGACSDCRRRHCRREYGCDGAR